MVNVLAAPVEAAWRELQDADKAAAAIPAGSRSAPSPRTWPAGCQPRGHQVVELHGPLRSDRLNLTGAVLAGVDCTQARFDQAILTGANCPVPR